MVIFQRTCSRWASGPPRPGHQDGLSASPGSGNGENKGKINEYRGRRTAAKRPGRHRAQPAPARRRGPAGPGPAPRPPPPALGPRPSPRPGSPHLLGRSAANSAPPDSAMFAELGGGGSRRVKGAGASAARGGNRGAAPRPPGLAPPRRHRGPHPVTAPGHGGCRCPTAPGALRGVCHLPAAEGTRGMSPSDRCGAPESVTSPRPQGR